MKRIFVYITIAASALLASVSCQKQGPDAPAQDADFVLSVSELKPTSVKISCSPKDKYQSYIAMVLEKKIFDRFTSDEALQADNLAYFKSLAQENETELYYVLEQFLIKGDLKEDLVNDLKSKTEYVLYAYGMDYRGDATSAVTKYYFTTPDYPDVEKVNPNFKLSISNVTYISATCRLTCDKGYRYALDLLSEEEYQQYGGNDNAFIAYNDEKFAYYSSLGYSDQELIDNLTLNYTSVDVPCSDLTPSTKYYVFALAVDEYFRSCSDPVYVTLVTDDATPSDNRFTVSISKTYPDGVSAWIYPYNNDMYFWDVVSKSDCEGKSDEQIIKALKDKYGSAINDLVTSGEAHIDNYHDLMPDTDYYIVVFGWDYAPTTSVTRKKFTTAPPVDYSTLSLSFETYDVASDSAKVLVTPSDNTITYCFSVALKSEFDKKVSALGSADKAVAALVDEEIAYYVKYYNNTYSASKVAEMIAKRGAENATFSKLSSNTEYVVWGASLNTAAAAAGCQKGFYTEFKTK